MLAGAGGEPVSICFTITNDRRFYLLPIWMDPLRHWMVTPGYFATFETLSQHENLYTQPNFGNPNASVLTQATPDLAVTLFTQACGGASAFRRRERRSCSIHWVTA